MVPGHQNVPSHPHGSERQRISVQGARESGPQPVSLSPPIEEGYARIKKYRKTQWSDPLIVQRIYLNLSSLIVIYKF